MNISFLPAYNGDCILLNYECKSQNINILIDGGIARTYPQILRSIVKEKEKKNEKIDLLIITHIDDDHLGGIIKLFEDSSIDKSIIKNIWFNSGESISTFFKSPIKKNRRIEIIPDTVTEMSIKDGITLEKEIKKYGLFTNDIIHSGDTLKIGDIDIEVLSPDIGNLEKLNKRWVREINKTTKMSSPTVNNYKIDLKKLKNIKFKKDSSVANGSSIAVLLKVKSKKILLLGDAHQSTIVDNLEKRGYSASNPLQVDLVKLSHHGSKHNTGYDLLKLIKCNDYVISTDGSKHNLPNKEVFARILETNNKSTFYFNYTNEITNNIFTAQDKVDYLFTCNYLENNNYKIII